VLPTAAICANGFRFRVPYGTLLCVSDKPLHGELKLAGMAGEFYRQRVDQHLEIGLRALEKLKLQERERLHSRKLTRLRGLGQFWIARPLLINGLSGKVFTTEGDWVAGRLRSAVEAEAAN
jgi:hypothetical protein